MLDLLQEVSTSWFGGVLRTLDGVRRGMQEPYPIHEDPPGATPYEKIFTSGKAQLRYYRAVGKRHTTPLLLVYALIKRPFILDLQPGSSLVQTLTQHGFEVYLVDWIPPTRVDAWRGFDAYVNQDLVNVVRAVQNHSGADQVSLLGYCFGGLLSTLYAALHPETVKNFLPLTLPFDMSKQDIALSHFTSSINPELIVEAYGNCPAWIMKLGFTSMSPVHHFLNKHVGLYRNKEREGYAETFELFERWMNSDVPLAGQIFRELTTEISRRNALVNGQFQVGGQRVDVRNIRCPVLNVVGEYDDVVHPQASLPLIEHIGSRTKQNLLFPAGHIGVVMSSGAQKKLWPQVATWLQQHDRKTHSRRRVPVSLATQPSREALQ
ncbi:MAG: alpha/beta fold hydrolase [Candidatus Binatia bacterium]